MEFTKTQQRILNVLSDGRRHWKKDLVKILADPEAEPATLSVHICLLRKKLKSRGEDIVCEYYQRRIHYRHVRLIGRGE